MKILLVEDDATLAQALGSFLRLKGYEILVAGDGETGLLLAAEARPDLMILDIMMPGIDGWETCRRLREHSDVPVLILTARGTREDVIAGLELGADDYVTKPFELRELDLRIAALLRRSGQPSADRLDVFDDGHLRIDLVRHTVFRDGTPVHLTPTEFRLLACLLRHRDQPVAHEQLLREVWGSGYVDDLACLQVYVRYLRAKLEVDPGHPGYIRTDHGIGYRFTAQYPPQMA